MDDVRAAFAIAHKDLRQISRYRLSVAAMIFNPLYQGIVPAFLFGASFAVGGRQLGLAASLGTEDLSGFIFMGGVVSAIVSVAFWILAFSIRTEMEAGTLEPSWLTPTRRETLVVGKAIYGVALLAFIQGVLFAIGIAFFGLRVRAETLWAVPAVVVSVVAMVGIGLLVAGLVLVVKEANFLVDTLQFMFSVVSGAAFPVTVLPQAAQVVAFALPTTWAIEILRHDAIGARPLADPAVEHVALLVTTVAVVALGSWAFRVADHRVRVNGTIGQH